MRETNWPDVASLLGLLLLNPISLMIIFDGMANVVAAWRRK